jgi:signal recognition particle receptor subunit beta/uncharacterized protein YjbI with pentapeptide repeats
MVQTNIVEREVVLRILYYGLPNAGKRSNLRAIVQKTPPMRRGDIKEERASETICSIQYTAPESLQIANMRVKCQIYTISCEVSDKNTLQEYFQGVDGIVFVTDSRADKERDNARALDQLEKHLKINGYNSYEIPLVFQWNKQDLKDVKSVAEWNSVLNERNVPAIKASAESGEGVIETLSALLDEVRNKVEEQLKVPSKRLPKKKLGIGLGKKEEKPEENVEETVRRNEVEPPAEKPFEEGKTKIKFNLPKLRPRSENKGSQEGTIAASSGTTAIKSSKPEMGTPPAFEEEEDILVSAKKSQTEEPLKREEMKKAEEPPKREEMKKTEEPPKREEMKKTEEPLKGTTRTEEPVRDTRPDTGHREESPKEEIRNKQEETVADDENRAAEAVAANFSKKMKPAKKLFPKKNMDEALQILEEGNTLENAYLDILDLSNRTFSKRIHIVKCQIGKLLADGGDFKAAVIIENSVVLDSFTLCGESPSLFRDVFHLKNVEIGGSINWERCLFCKDVTISDCIIDTVVKMPGIVCDQGFSILNSKVASLSAQKSQIRGAFLISGSTMDNIAAWHKTSFYGPFLASSTNFQRAHFIDCFFKEKVEFARCIFEKGGNFGKIACEKGISFEGCVFNGVANLAEASLKSENYFRRTEFVGDTTCNRLLVSGSLILEKVTFSSLADFSGANLARSEFLQTTFHADANFQEAIFTETTSLQECVFNQRAFFCRAIFLQKLDFRGCQFNRAVSFANAIGDYIVLERKQIENKLVAEQQKDYPIIEQEYHTLRQIFERQKNYEDRDWAHSRSKRAARQKIPFSLLHPLRSLQKAANWFFWDLGCGYGTKPGNIIWLSLAIILLCAGLYGGLWARDLALPQDAINKWPAAVWHSVVCFIPGGIFFINDDFVSAGIDILQPLTWRDTIVSLLQFAPKLTMLCENLLGLLLIFLFMLALIRKLLQD